MTAVWVELGIAVGFVLLLVLTHWSGSQPVEPHPAQLLTGRPVTREGRYLTFEGGYVARLSLWSWALFALGIRTHLSTRTKERRSV